MRNGDEEGVDCGGSCKRCITCTDLKQNGDETGVDCGGSCDACASCSTWTKCNKESQNVNADAVCGTTKCGFADAATCCADRAECSTVTCGATQLEDGEEYCKGAKCEEGECCVDRATCAGFGLCLEDVQTLKSAELCRGADKLTCDAATCCEDKMCPDGDFPIAVAKEDCGSDPFDMTTCKCTKKVDPGACAVLGTARHEHRRGMNIHAPPFCHTRRGARLQALHMQTHVLDRSHHTLIPPRRPRLSSDAAAAAAKKAEEDAAKAEEELAKAEAEAARAKEELLQAKEELKKAKAEAARVEKELALAEAEKERLEQAIAAAKAAPAPTAEQSLTLNGVTCEGFKGALKEGTRLAYAKRTGVACWKCVCVCVC